VTDEKKTKIALWQNNASAGSTTPSLKGAIEFPDGTKRRVSLWRNNNKAKRAPTFLGVVDEKD